MITLLSTLLVLGILIFVHELGHFLLAKWAGVGVRTFSLGFGPKLLGFIRGGTEYRLSAIPLGGFVRMLGEHSDDELTSEEASFAFIKKSVWWRIAIVAAGPIFNFIFAIILYYLVIVIWGLPILTAKIGDVVPGEPAALAGVVRGDLVVAADSYPIQCWEDLSLAIISSQGQSIQLTLLREGREFNLTIQPHIVIVKDAFGEEHQIYRVGIFSSGESIIQHVGALSAFSLALEKSYLAGKLIVLTVVKLFQGKVSLETLGGPIQIGQAAGQAARLGLVEFLILMSILSVNLAIFNLLPIPALDGGHVFFFIWEAITRSSIPITLREKAQKIGIFFLLILMAFIIYNDISRLIVSVFK